MLNESQLRAVKVHGHCLISACPGSGKTTVLKYRAAEILGDSTQRVVGVTFTAEAAKELERRIWAQVPEARSRITCGTFHSLCKRQLEEAGHTFRLANAVQQLDYMRRAFADCEPVSAGVDLDACIKFIEKIKSAVDPMLPSVELEPCVPVYQRYQQFLNRSGSYDFSDLLRLSVRGMRKPAGMKGAIQPLNATHLLVDEFQDTDAVQFEWVKEHIKRGIFVTVVGDDDQSIYSWRHAMGIDGMYAFQTLTQATHITLGKTYRFPQEILTPSDALIQCNKQRIPKALATDNHNKGRVRVVGCQDSKIQHKKVWAAIRDSGEPGQWAVLARTNYLLEDLEASNPYPELKVKRIGGRSFWEMRGPALYLSLLGAFVLGEMHSLDIVLRSTGASENSLAELHQHYQSRTPGAIARFISDKKQKSINEPEERLRNLMKQWRRDLDKGNTDHVLRVMGSYLTEHTTAGVDETNLKRTKRAHARIEASAETLVRMKADLPQRIHALTQKKDKSDPDAVSLMTLHASKGLEFPHIWIMSCEDGLIPSTKSPIDEERRLFYVGMTRSMADLTVSYVIGKKKKPSPFLAEAGLNVS